MANKIYGPGAVAPGLLSSRGYKSYGNGAFQPLAIVDVTAGELIACLHIKALHLNLVDIVKNDAKAKGRRDVGGKWCNSVVDWCAPVKGIVN